MPIRNTKSSSHHSARASSRPRSSISPPPFYSAFTRDGSAADFARATPAAAADAATDSPAAAAGTGTTCKSWHAPDDGKVGTRARGRLIILYSAPMEGKGAFPRAIFFSLARCGPRRFGCSRRDRCEIDFLSGFCLHDGVGIGCMIELVLTGN